jgi:hypothetical protein
METAEEAERAWEAAWDGMWEGIERRRQAADAAAAMEAAEEAERAEQQAVRWRAEKLARVDPFLKAARAEQLAAAKAAAAAALAAAREDAEAERAAREAAEGDRLARAKADLEHGARVELAAEQQQQQQQQHQQQQLLRRQQQQRPRGGRSTGVRAHSAQAGHGRGRSAVLPAWFVAQQAAEIGQQQQQGSGEAGRQLGEEGRAAAASAAARAAAVAAVAAAAATSAAAAAQQQQQRAQRQAAAERTARVHTEGAHVERGRRATRHQQRMRQTVHSLATDLGRLSSAGRGAQRERDGLAVQVAALQARLAQVEGSEAAEESASKEAEPAGAVGKQSAANARRRRRRQCAAEQQRGAQQRAAGSGRADGLAGGVNVRLGGLESHVQMQTKAIAEVARVVEAGYNPSVIHNGTIIRKQRAQIKKLEKQVASAQQVASHGTGGHGFCPSANARPGFGSGTARRDHGWAPNGQHRRRGGGRQRGW